MKKLRHFCFIYANSENVVVVVVVVAELQQERRPLRSTSTVDDGLWQLWKLI